MGSIILVNIAGAVALLLWGLHMVHTGIIRTFGSNLRLFLNRALRNRVSAFLTGLGLTAVLQSSTATALMTTSLAAEGLIGLMPALAIMLGANVGTTLIVQVLSFNVFALSPFLIVSGVIAFRSGRKSRLHQFGRILIGFGLLTLALHLLVEWMSPMESTPGLRTFLNIAADQPLICLLAAAALTWIIHSSVATVLLVISFAHAQLLPPQAALTLVLGANLGSAINPLFEAGKPGDLVSKRVPVGNLINRLVGVILVFPFLDEISARASKIQPSVALLAGSFHVIFNLLLALIFIIPLPVVRDLLVSWLPEKANPDDPGRPRYLNEQAVATPAIALSDAIRETLRIADVVEQMLKHAMTALLSNDKVAAELISDMDDIVDRLEGSVRLYIARLTRETLAHDEATRADQIASFAINLEHIGDIVDKNLREIAIKKIKRNASFSGEGASEIRELYERVHKSLRLSLSVFVTGDLEAGRLLLQEKVLTHRSEREATANHFSRLREGRPETMETMSMHVDVLRDLGRIHSHICSVMHYHQNPLEEAL